MATSDAGHDSTPHASRETPVIPRPGSEVQVTVLGPVGIRRLGEPVELGGRLRRLLAGLVVSAGNVVSSDRLIAIVWDDSPPAGAEKAVRTYVSRLRKALGDDHAITFREPGYVLDLGPEGLDAAVFDDELDRTQSLLRTADYDEAARLVESAASRWSGPAYAGFAEEEWVRPEAVRLEERLVEAREALIEAMLATDRPDEAVALAQSLVEAEPLRERPRGLLMRSLHASGRQAEALRAYRTYRTHLAEETGLEPTDDLVDLEGRIARDDPSLSGSIRPLRGYQLGDRIGEGAYSVVHRAVQPGVEREVAIKIIRPELADRPDFIRRFELEARTVARIEHPNVVPIVDFWREPGAAYLVMRLLDGGSVEHALRRDGPFAVERVLRVLDDVGGALAAAHHRSIVHRDVRPANLLLDTDGTTYLSDFGIALPVASVDDSPVISPAYAAPEVLRNEPVGASADVFALGVTLFELLAGRTPFADTLDRRDLIRRQLSDTVPPLTTMRSDLPTAIDAVLVRATSKDPAERHGSVAALVDDVRRALAAPGAAATRTDPRWRSDPENPFVGLHRFDEEDAGRFFGREELVAELVEALASQRLVVAVGPSGSGKSSVVRAGLLPEIRRGAIAGSDRWFVAPMLPGSDPVAGLEAALLRVAVNPPSSLRDQLSESGGLLRAIRRVLPDDDSELLLVVDQFEELFTQVDDAEVRDRFLAELATAVTDPRSPLRVVATLRADHYDAPLRDPSLAQLVTDGTVTVRPMTPAELERAITRPAEEVGIDVEPALVTELVAGVSASPAALPLLQFSLTELFDRRVADTMLLSSHLELGGLAGALAARAERILDAGGPDDVDAARRIFGRLAAFGEGLDDRRRRAMRSEFGHDERTTALLDAFVEARLLTTDRDTATRQPTVEVAHEALLREWPRVTEWLAADRDVRRSVGAIGQAAATWDAGGRQGADLYRGPRLDAALDVADTAADRLVALDLEFLGASRRHAAAEREVERRRIRRLRRLVVGTAAALVVALIAGAVAVTQQRRADREAREAEMAATEADRQREVAIERAEEADGARAEADAQRSTAEDAADRAEQEAARAESATSEAELAELTARATAAAVERPEQALLLALEAHRRAPGPDTVRALLDTMTSGRIGNQVDTVGRLPAGGCGGFGLQRRLSTDGLSEFAVVEGDLLRQDLLTGEVTRHGAAPTECAGWWEDEFTGRRWATSSDVGAHWIADDGGQWRFLERDRVGGALLPEPIEGRFLFGENSDRVARSVDVAVVDAVTLEPLARPLPELAFEPGDLPVPVAGNDVSRAFAARGSSDGGTRGGLVVVLDATTGAERFRVELPSLVTAMAFSADGSRLLVGRIDGAIAVVDTASGLVTRELTMTESPEVISLGERVSDGVVVAVSGRSIERFDPSGRSLGVVGIAPTGEAYVRPDGTVASVLASDDDTINVTDPDGGPLVEQGWDADEWSPVGLGEGRATGVGRSGELTVVDLGTGDRSDTALRGPDGGDFRPVAVVPHGDGFLGWDDGRTLVRWSGGEVADHAELWTSSVPISLRRGSVLTGIPSISEQSAVVETWNTAPAGGAVVVYEFETAHAVYVFDPDRSELVVEELLDTPPFSTTAAVRARDGGVHVALHDGTLRTYAADGRRLDEIDGGVEAPMVMTVDSAGGLIAMGGSNGVAVIDPATSEVRRIDDVGPVASLGFAREGTVLVLVGTDGDVRLWDAERSLSIGTLWSGTGTAPASTPWYDEDTDSVWVATSGKLLNFSLDPARWIDRVCELVSRELSAEEWERLVPGDEPQRPACP